MINRYTETSESSLGNKYVYQNVNVNRAGVSFNIYGEAKANSVPLSNENRTFGVALNIYYKDNAVPEMHYQEFNAETTAKQSVSMTVIPENEDLTIDYVAFAFVYGYNKNVMTIYNAMLNIAPSNVDMTSDSEDSETDTDNSEDTSADEDNYIDYEVISETVDKSKAYMQTSTVYDSTGNYVTSETDESGNTVSYTYDASGNTTSVTDAEGDTVNYSYNSSNLVTSVSSQNAENTYTYTGNKDVLSIGHNGFSYDFNYDVFSNLISTKIGDVAIASNIYSANNGNLTKTTFANGDYIEYTYDDYDNVIKITGENGTLAEFVYNKKGLVAKSIDSANGETAYYNYDIYGTLIEQYAQSSSGKLTYSLGTDTNGNTVEKTSINGQTKTITSGTDDDGNAFVSNDGVTVSDTSDDFGRKTQVKTSHGESEKEFYTDYIYSTSPDNATDNVVYRISQKYGDTELINYKYEYNANGNIERIYENGEQVSAYSYDEFNQLSWSADANTGLYTQFIYDSAGNINSVKEYALSSEGWYPSYLIEERVYSYTDTNWKDKLTAYKGTTITYDEVGNPLNYRDGMSFEWKNGRILKSITTSDVDLEMTYNYKGMRTQKSDGSTTTNYYYDSNNNLLKLQ